MDGAVMSRMELKVTINGTNANPWNKMGLTRNPFPQIPRAELMPFMDTLAKLDGDPISDTDQIKSILKGWSQEFVELCCQKFELGKRVCFTVEFGGGL